MFQNRLEGEEDLSRVVTDYALKRRLYLHRSIHVRTPTKQLCRTTVLPPDLNLAISCS